MPKKDPLTGLQQTVDEILGTLTPEQAEVGQTVAELEGLLGKTNREVRRILQQAQALGRLVCLPKPIIDIAGRHLSIPSYKITK